MKLTGKLYAILCTHTKKGKPRKTLRFVILSPMTDVGQISMSGHVVYCNEAELALTPKEALEMQREAQKALGCRCAVAKLQEAEQC